MAPLRIKIHGNNQVSPKFADSPVGKILTINALSAALRTPSIRRAANCLAISSLLKTNRPNQPTCFQHLIDYQYISQPAELPDPDNRMGQSVHAWGGIVEKK